MPRLADPSSGFHFNPSHAAFQLAFARVDERNFYSLSFSPKEKRLTLSKTVNGKAGEPIGAAADLDAFDVVTVWLRPYEIRIELDGRSVITSNDTAFRADGRQLRQPGMAPAKLLPVAADPAFEEGFEDHAAAGQYWQPAAGAWSIHAPYDELVRKKNGPPMFSAYRADDPEYNMAVRVLPAPADVGQAPPGDLICGNIRLRAKVRIEQSTTAGVAFNIRGKETFSALAITPAADGKGKIQLLDVAHGKRTELCAREPADLRPNQWYELCVETCGDAAWCSVNGELELNGCQPAAITSGGVGLVAWGPGVLFDDVRLRSLASFADRLDRRKPRLWEIAGDTEAAASGVKLSGRADLKIAPPASKRIDVDLAGPPEAEGGIIANCATATASHAFGWFNGQWQLRRTIGSKPAVLASAAAERPERCRITLIDRNGLFTGMVDGRTVVETCDPTLRTGGVGLIGANASFSNFRLAEDDSQQGVEVFFTDFAAQKAVDRISMRESDILNDVLKAGGMNWELVTRAEGGALTCTEADTLRFREIVAGDVAVSARVSHTGSPTIGIDPIRPGAKLQASPTYTFGVNEYGTGFVMTSFGNRLVPQAIRGKPQVMRIELMRFAGSVIAYADGTPGLKFAERERLPANGISFSGEGGCSFHGISIRALKASFYPFDEVSPAWLERGGEWTLRAGLSDPNLKHWVTGIADDGTGLLVERMQRAGAFTWCVTVAPATEGYADGGNTTFPIRNVVLGFCCAGGRLDAGYALQVRPEGKKVVRLLKNGVRAADVAVTARAEDPVRIRITKVDGKITADCGEKDVLTFTDDAPLDAGHLILGVDHSRARFSDVLVLPMD